MVTVGQLAIVPIGLWRTGVRVPDWHARSGWCRWDYGDLVRQVGIARIGLSRVGAPGRHGDRGTIGNCPNRTMAHRRAGAGLACKVGMVQVGLWRPGAPGRDSTHRTIAGWRSGTAW